jgi:hypothetical protein
MPWYFFNIRNGNHYVPDRDGCELPSLDTVPSQAAGVAREMMRRPGHQWANAAFEVTNREGRLVYFLRSARSSS